MDLDHLKGFFYAARLGSFTEAAAKLFLSQPAISHQIKALEKTVGERLFDRTGRSIRLTHAGEVLYREVERVLGSLDDLEVTLTEFRDLERGGLRLGASDTVCLYYLPCVLQRFHELHPRIELKLTSRMSSQVARMVLDRDLDLGLVTLSQVPERLESEPLLAMDILLLVPSSHALAGREAVSFSELLGCRQLSLEKGSQTRAFLQERLGRLGVLAPPALELSNFEVLRRYVAAGLGVGLVPAVVAHAAGAGAVAVKMTEPLSIEVGVIYRKDSVLSRPARSFLELARAHFKGLEEPGRRCASSGPPLS